MGAANSKSSSKSSRKDAPECACKECREHTNYWDRSFFLTTLWESSAAEQAISKVWNVKKLTSDKEGQRVLDTTMINFDKLSTRKFRRWYRKLDYSLEVWARYVGTRPFSPLNLAAHDSQRFLERLVSLDFDQKKLFEKYKVELWFKKVPRYHERPSIVTRDSSSTTTTKSSSSSIASSDGSIKDLELLKELDILDFELDLAPPIKILSKIPTESKSLNALSGDMINEIKWKIMGMARKPNDPHYYNEEYPEMAYIQTVLPPLKRHRSF